MPKLLNQHFIPRYQGFVPGLNCENSMAKNYTKLATECIRNFDKKRFNPSSLCKNDWQFNPISTTLGEFSKKNFSQTIKSTDCHGFTSKLKESGYSNNISTMDKTGWVPSQNFHSKI